MSQKTLIELLAVLAVSAPAVAATNNRLSMAKDAGSSEIAAQGKDGGMSNPQQQKDTRIARLGGDGGY
jgi:hypothetical protein